MLTDQWFVDHDVDTRGDGKAGLGRRKAITEPALDAVRSGEIRFVPENWTTTYTQWLDNIQDWCICRQLWWGHQIPAWYDEAGNIFVGEDEADARAQARVHAGGRAAPGRRRARHVVLVGAVAVLDAGLAGYETAASRTARQLPAERRCWSPASTSSSSGSRAWS